MIRKIELIEVSNLEEGIIKETRPHLFKLDSIDRLTTSKFSGFSWIYPSDNQDRILVKGDYRVIKDLLEEVRTEIPPKLCYVFQQSVVGSTYSHYVPTDTVGSIMVNKGSNIVTLVLKTGEKINTGLIMAELKKTLIEVRF